MRIIVLTTILLAACMQFGTAQPNPDIDGLCRTLLTSPNEALRKNAAHTLGQIALILGPDTAAKAIPALMDASQSDRSASVRQEAQVALTSIGTGKAETAQYLKVMGTTSNLAEFDIASQPVFSYVDTASADDVADLQIVQNLRAPRDGLYSNPPSVPKAFRLLKIFNLFRRMCERSRDRTIVIADLQETLVRFAPIARDQRDTQIPANAFMQAINGLSYCGTNGVKTLLDTATQQFSIDDKIDAQISLQTTWASQPQDFILQERGELLDLGMYVLNTFPNSWRCNYAVALPTFSLLGSFAALAKPKLQMIAALSEHDARERYGFPVCGQSEAQQALQVIP